MNKCFFHSTGRRLPDTLEFLYEIGVDMAEQDDLNFGKDLFHVAVEKRAFEYWLNATQRLVEFGIDVNAREQQYGRRALHVIALRSE